MKIAPSLAVLAAALALTAGPVSSAGAPAHSSAQFGDANLSTDEIDANNNSGDFTMPHKVTLTQPGTDATGDSARGNFKRRTVTLTGNVVVHQNKASGPGAKPGDQPSTLTTDVLTVDWANKIYTAVGNVHFTQGARTMTAERGTLNESTHDLDLSGNVRVLEADRTASAQNVHYNTQSEDVKMQGNVSATFPVPNNAGPPKLGVPAPKPRATR